MFREWKEKYDIVDDEVDDTMTFHYKNTYIFRPDLSGNLTGDEIIVVPHPCKSLPPDCQFLVFMHISSDAYFLGDYSTQ